MLWMGRGHSRGGTYCPSILCAPRGLTLVSHPDTHSSTKSCLPGISRSAPLGQAETLKALATLYFLLTSVPHGQLSSLHQSVPREAAPLAERELLGPEREMSPPSVLLFLPGQNPIHVVLVPDRKPLRLSVCVLGSEGTEEHHKQQERMRPKVCEPGLQHPTSGSQPSVPVPHPYPTPTAAPSFLTGALLEGTVPR